MSESHAALIWIFGIFLWTLIRMPHRRRAKRTEIVSDQKSNGEKLALTLCIIGLVIVPALHLITGFLKFANTPFNPFVAIIGTLAMAGFLLMFYFSHKHLAKNWSVSLEIRKDHELVQHGIYRHIRHPMYTSFWLWGLAQLMLVPNWIAGLTGLASVAWLYFSRIENEEAMMRAQFGEKYEEYCRTTSRLIPKLF